MNKKRNFLAIIILLLLLISGCTKTSKNNNDSSKSTKVTETKLFNKMSKGNRSDVKFTFKKNEGTTVNANSIDLTIDNKSNTKVKFNLEDFILSGTSDTHSDRTGMKTIAPNKKVTFKKLFQDVDDEVFDNPGLFVYKTDSFKLAYLDGKISKSSNLKDSKLKKEYLQFKKDKNSSSNNSENLTVDDNNSNSNSNDNTTDSSNDTTTQSDDSATDSSSDSSITSGQEAMTLVEKQNGPATGNEKYYSNDEVWNTKYGKSYWVVLSEPNPESPDIQMPRGSWMVFFDGTIMPGRPIDNQD
ncbi:hypothetical protein [Companilactobacillus baiquanensis]|uniref:DUF4352 domain-containing protein n=1 Tax=Companilactobacillus baiquanensis TaxID=2486005 RepID=A0ABW1UW76_9LACO|nr:hypothetical protein [Companilactobacillus baiquanensis]